MNGRVAKALRRKYLGKGYSVRARQLGKDDKGQVWNIGKRQNYRQAKKRYNRGEKVL